MQRVRRAVVTALALVLALGLTSGPAARGWFAPAAVAAADVTWPPSTLVVSELQTGGTSASDEFVEIANQGTGPVDLIGLEVVYATSSGSTVTRKATWTVVVDPRAGPARPPGEQRRRLRGHRRRAVYGRLCGDRWRAGAARRRRRRGRRHRLGRCHEHLRRGDRRTGAADRVQPGAAPRWRVRQRHRHERQRRRLGRVVHTEPTGAGIASGPGSGSVADSRSVADPGPDGRAEPDDHADARPGADGVTEAHPVDRADRDRTLDAGRRRRPRSRAC